MRISAVLADWTIFCTALVGSLCKLKKLEELDLNHNLFEGILPPCLSNLRSLKFFDISLNKFTGNISPSLFGSLNSLDGNDKFEVETEDTNWIPMFQLNVLVLSNYNLNKLSGDVPKFLLYQNKLRLIDLSHNNLTDSFTNWLLVNDTGLEVLNLQNNSFVSQFCLPSCHYVNTYWMDVSNNHLSGPIQANMGNAFEGGIPSSFVIFNLTHIWHLQLNDNQFTGPLTNVLSKLSNLNFLDISNNYMSIPMCTGSKYVYGRLLSLIFGINTFFLLNPKLGSVELVHLQGNKFTGLIPRALFNSSNLLTFDIRENSFSGSIPDSIGENSSVKRELIEWFNSNLGYTDSSTDRSMYWAQGRLEHVVLHIVIVSCRYGKNLCHHQCEKHRGVCYQTPGARYRYGKMDHTARNCPRIERSVNESSALAKSVPVVGIATQDGVITLIPESTQNVVTIIPDMVPARAEKLTLERGAM
ncbi:hypothetical protein HYC85_027703 [Camellia sinensis]|uniref:Leucine-rich repeat-containing N-terminal plant-type domain-containing protein n=1 Tax=Camellia sinensis TaxID=4442 RepID=A0A7J7FT85_CAMSI|nr:hypothetical protein HYC85_027703 [Camellia sinensis]